MSGVFESCRHCVKPKRHPGCHDHCPDYKRERAEYDALVAAANADKEVRAYVQNIYAKNRAADAKRKQKRRKHYNYGNL